MKTPPRREPKSPPGVCLALWLLWLFIFLLYANPEKLYNLASDKASQHQETFPAFHRGAGGGYCLPACAIRHNHQDGRRRIQPQSPIRVVRAEVGRRNALALIEDVARPPPAWTPAYRRPCVPRTSLPSFALSCSPSLSRPRPHLAAVFPRRPLSAGGVPSLPQSGAAAGPWRASRPARPP